MEIDDRVWYRTKDYCRLGEDGLVYYVDRAADVIKYKGYRVSASEIESVLQSHPLVIGAVWWVCLTPEWGAHQSHCGVEGGRAGVGSQELMGFCRGRLAACEMLGTSDLNMGDEVWWWQPPRRWIRDEERRQTGD